MRRRAALTLFVALSITPCAGQSGTSPADPLAGRFGGPFRLTDHAGRRVRDTDFRGRYMLIYFGFTRCTETCPLDVPVMAAALDALGPRADLIAPLFITIDPENDTPDVLRAYVEGHHARLIGLTGSEAEIAAVARAYRVHRMRVDMPAGGAHATHHHHGASWTISHGSLMYLMGPDGGFLTLLPHGTTADRLADVLRARVV